MTGVIRTTSKTTTRDTQLQMAFALVRKLQMVTLTASERISARPLAPIPLPESDTGSRRLPGAGTGSLPVKRMPGARRTARPILRAVIAGYVTAGTACLRVRGHRRGGPPPGVGEKPLLPRPGHGGTFSPVPRFTR
jgi:hypothetical protein